MEWIVPVLFVLATVAQWWLKRHQGSADTPASPTEKRRTESPGPVSQDPFEDLGDLLEALGRRRHESPPPPVLPSPVPTPAPSPVVELKPIAPLILPTQIGRAHV